MPKFVKDVIEKAKEAKRATSAAIKLKTALKGKQGLYTFYSIWFSTIDSFIGGNPSFVMKQSWKVYVIPFVPKDWVCDDFGFEGVKAKRRCQLIYHGLNKTGKISKKEKLWLKTELLPAFKKDFADKSLDFEKLGEMKETEIESKLKQAKGEKKFKEMMK